MIRHDFIWGDPMRLAEAITKLAGGADLDALAAEAVFDSILAFPQDPEALKRFLVLLYHKGESVGEILGAVRSLRKSGRSIRCASTDLVDCCGTGGDQKGTFNISTAAAFVLAGAGCHVAKHGNRAMSSQSGSADVLAALGVRIDAPEDVVVRCIDEIGIGFLFAPNYYPLLATVAPVRRSLPHRTIFNILGPLLNPAGAKRQLIGVFDDRIAQILPAVLQGLGAERVVVVHAEDGTDEVSLSCNTNVHILNDNRITHETFDPRSVGYAYCPSADLKGGTAAENAARLKRTLAGDSHALDHAVHLNAAWGLVAAGRVFGIMDGLLMAQDAVSSGRAYAKLEALSEATQG